MGAVKGAAGAILRAVALSMCMAVAALPGRAWAAEPPTAPILRIETGRHTSVVTKMAVDASQTLLATASLDKTVRLWSLPDGQPIATLRVPVGDGPEGNLYATALSPDGKTVLATGYTGSWDGTYSIYLFDVNQRRLKTRLPKLPALVNDVAFSPDGAVFAAVFSGRNGFAVWSATNGKLLAEDKDYGDIATGLALDRTGRVATISLDGMVRLYGANYQLAAKVRAPGGKRPLSVAFAPDGQKLAVGYEDSGRVDVLSAADLKQLYAVDTRGLDGGNLAAVGWSADGKELFAAGSARDKSGKVVLRRWSDAGKGAARDTAVARDAVMHVLGAAKGGALFASADPAWGRVDPDGKLALKVDGQIADFRDIADGRFAISADGTVVEFGMEQGGKKPIRADLTALKLVAEPARDAQLDAPATRVADISVTDWKNAAQPKINGKAVTLHPGELARSAAVVPDAGRALVGTSEGLRLYDAKGSEIAAATMPGEVWGIAVARNGKVAVAALGDGTLRWVSLERADLLAELAVLFVRGDASRWMAWTKEGFFAHSDGGGADMAGYHINQGTKATPEWVEFGRLYQLFYAPELIARKVTRTGEADIKAKLAKIGSVAKVLGEKPAPTVELVEYCPVKLADTRAFSRVETKPAANVAGETCLPIVAAATRGFSRLDKPAAAGPTSEAPIFATELPAGTNGVKLRFKLIDRQGGLGDVDVFVNDRMVAATRGFGRVNGPASASSEAGMVMEREVALEPGRNQVWVRAYNGANAVDAKSPRVEFALTNRGPVQAAAQPAGKPRLLVLATGIDRYDGPNALRFAVKDMNDVVQAVQKNRAESYGSVEVTSLTDKEVTVANLEKKFDELAQKVRPEDTVLLYFSGHGVTDERQPTAPYYYVMADGDIDNLEKTGFSQARFKSNLAKLPTKNVLMLLDTCHSGALTSSVIDKVHEDFGKSFYILAAAASDQKALDSYKGMNGPFAYAVIEGLNGEASDKRGQVNQLNLGTYVTTRVPELVDQQKPGHAQKANFKFAAANGELSGFSLTKAAK